MSLRLTRRRIAAAAAAMLAVASAGVWLASPAPISPDTWMSAAGLAPLRTRVGEDEIRYVRVGSGPPVILVHGFGSSLYTWKDVIPDLALRHEVVALDLPGFGGSSQPAALDFARLPAAVTGLADQLGLDRFALVGHSLGGATSTLVAARHPERVTRLVLVDAAGYNSEPHERPALLRLIASPAGAVLEALPAPPRALVWFGLRQVFEDPAKVDEARVEAYLAPMTRPGAAAAARALLVSPRGDRQFSAIARAVRAPTLVIWGRDDAWTPLAQAALFAGDIAGAQVAVLGPCGHMPQEERPADVQRLLRDFLAG